jgi:ankyrin repeat protein
MLSELMRLYIWLLGEKIEPPVDFGTPANQLMVNKALEYIKEKHQSFIREARATYYNIQSNTTANLSSPAIKPSSSMETEQESLIAATFKTVEDYGHVRNFLSFCNNFLQDKDSATLCALALSYLVESETLVFPEKQAKVAVLFAQFIELDEEQALCLYKNSNFAKNFPATTLLVNVKAVTHEMKRLDRLLHHETNLLGITPLFREKFFDVNELAALILYVLKSGVTTQQLIENRMLHDFLNYHLPALDSPDSDSAVKQLYAVLGQFSEANDLIKQVSSRVAKLNNYYEGVSLWLNGERLEKEKLGDAIIETSFTLTITEDNFKNLHTLFGNRFLVEALALFARNKDNALKELLISWINEKEDCGLTLLEISDFIKAIAKDTPHLLKVLAKIINDKTIHALLQARKGAIFYFAPYKPDILNSLENMDSLQDYMSVIESNDNAYDTIGQLIVLLRCAKNPNVEKLLYSKILRLTRVNPSLQEDDAVFNCLKRYTPKYNEMIQQQANNLVEELKQSIENNMLSKNDFSKDACINVADSWRDACREFSFLKRLNKGLDSEYPTDKYAFYAYLVNCFVKEPTFNLGDFLKNIFPPQDESPEEISEFERVLIEILAADDPLVRESAIALLEATPRKNKQSINSEAVSIALMEASLNGHTKVVELLLLRYKADINKAYKYGETLLFVAAAKGHAEVVKLLLVKEGIDVNKENYYAHSYDERGFDNINNTPLLVAVAKGHAKVVELLLAKKGIEINGATRGETPLVLAAKYGHTEIVTLLLIAGADVNKAALMVAVSNGHAEVVKLLLAHKEVDVNKADNNGKTLLFVAAAKGHVGVVKLLLAKKGVDVNKTNQYGETPLKQAAERGHAEAVKLLLAKKGVDVNKASGYQGWIDGYRFDDGYKVKLIFKQTPLMEAVRNGHAEVVKLLLAHKEVDVNKAGYGGTPLLAAVARRHAEVVKLLLEEGVDVNKAYLGLTPLALAVHIASRWR